MDSKNNKRTPVVNLNLEKQAFADRIANRIARLSGSPTITPPSTVTPKENYGKFLEETTFASAPKSLKNVPDFDEKGYADHLRSKADEIRDSGLSVLDKIGLGAARYGTMGGAALGYLESTPEEVAANIYEEAANEYEAPKKNQDVGFFKGMWEGAKSNFDGESLATLGLKGAGKSLSEASSFGYIAHKVKTGQPLTDTENEIINAFKEQQDSQGYTETQGGKTVGAKVGEVAAYMPEFMAQMAATGGFGAAAKTGAVKVAEKIGVEIGEKFLKKNLLQKGIRATAGAGIDALGRTPFQAQLYKNYADETIKQYGLDTGEDGDTYFTKEKPTSVGSRAYKALANTWIENFTENMGAAVLDKIPVRQLAGRLIKGMDKADNVALATDNIFASGARTVNQPSYVKSAQSFVKDKLKWDGTVNEFLEEEISNVIQPILTGDMQDYKENFSLENQWVTLLSCAAFQPVFKAVEVPAYAKNALQTRQSKKNANNALAAIQNPELKQMLSGAMQEQTVSGRAKVLSAVDWANLDVDDRMAGADYILNKTQHEALTGAVRGAEEQKAVALLDQHVNQSVNQSYSIPAVTTIYTKDGKAFNLLKGDWDIETNEQGQSSYTFGTDALMVQDVETGERKVINAKDIEIEHIDEYEAKEYRDSMFMQWLDQRNTANDQQDQQDEQEEQAIATPQKQTTQPNVNLEVNNPAAPVPTEILNGTKITRNGSDYIVTAELQNGFQIQPIDPDTGEVDGEAVPERISKTEINSIVSSRMEAQQVAPDQIATPAQQPAETELLNQVDTSSDAPVQLVQEQERPTIPTLEDGSPDYDNMEPEMLAQQIAEEYGVDEAVAELSGRIEENKKNAERLSKKATKSINERMSNKREVARLNSENEKIQSAIRSILPSEQPVEEVEKTPPTAVTTVNTELPIVTSSTDDVVNDTVPQLPKVTELVGSSVNMEQVVEDPNLVESPNLVEIGNNQEIEDHVPHMENMVGQPHPREQLNNHIQVGSKVKGVDKYGFEYEGIVKDIADSGVKVEVDEGDFITEKVFQPENVSVLAHPKSQESAPEEEQIKANIEAEEQKVNQAPTKGQRDAGNYQKGHIRLHGLDISIENPKGSTRSGTDKDGKQWSIEMNNTYGYIKGTMGNDKDHIDTFLGENHRSKKVFIINQVNPDGSFDEHKVLFGFDNARDAKEAYLSNYEQGWQGAGSLTEMGMKEFKEWLPKRNKQYPASSLADKNQQKRLENAKRQKQSTSKYKEITDKEPQTFEEWVLQWFLKGGKLKKGASLDQYISSAIQKEKFFFTSTGEDAWDIDSPKFREVYADLFGLSDYKGQHLIADTLFEHNGKRSIADRLTSLQLLHEQNDGEQYPTEEQTEKEDVLAEVYEEPQMSVLVTILESQGIDPNSISSIDEIATFIAQAHEEGIFVFPYSAEQYQDVLNYIEHARQQEQQSIIQSIQLEVKAAIQGGSAAEYLFGSVQDSDDRARIPLQDYNQPRIDGQNENGRVADATQDSFGELVVSGEVQPATEQDVRGGMGEPSTGRDLENLTNEANQGAGDRIAEVELTPEQQTKFEKDSKAINETIGKLEKARKKAISDKGKALNEAQMRNGLMGDVTADPKQASLFEGGGFELTKNALSKIEDEFNAEIANINNLLERKRSELGNLKENIAAQKEVFAGEILNNRYNIPPSAFAIPVELEKDKGFMRFLERFYKASDNNTEGFGVDDYEAELSKYLKRYGYKTKWGWIEGKERLIFEKKQETPAETSEIDKIMARIAQIETYREEQLAILKTLHPNDATYSTIEAKIEDIDATLEKYKSSLDRVQGDENKATPSRVDSKPEFAAEILDTPKTDRRKEPKKVIADKSELGANNKGVTAERAEELKRKLRAKLGQMNSGVDPEVVTLATELAAFYVEAGIHKFADFVTQMVEDLGENIAPYLKSAYLGAQGYDHITDDVVEEMNTTSEVRKVDVNALINELNLKENGKQGNEAIPNQPSGSTSKLDERGNTLNPSGEVVEQHPQEVSNREGGNGRVDIGNEDERGLPAERSNGIRERVPSTSIGSDTKKDEPKRVQGSTTPSRNVKRNGSNYRIASAENYIPQGEIAKVKGNLEAIKLLKELEKKGKKATAEQKKVLAQYVGWGGLSTILNTDNYNNAKKYSFNNPWKEKYLLYYEQVRDLLTDDEFIAAVGSTINAHYTDGKIIQSMWDMAKHFGFKGGNVLEPAVGVGHFFGFMPKVIAENSNLYGYELDSLTGRIAKFLYPDANIEVTGYENSTIKPNSIDLIITNVPFGQTAPYDKLNKDLSKFNLHNYFIAKGIRQLSEGGIGMFITSTSTMDGASGVKFRKWATNEGGADFIGAIRLPNNAFSENAGTSVTTDIIIYRKRSNNEISDNAQENHLLKTIREWKDSFGDGKEHSLIVNEYFEENPNMMLGEMYFSKEVGRGGLYSHYDQTCQAKKDSDILKGLNKAIKSLPSNIATSEAKESVNEKKKGVKSKIVVRDGKVVMDNGTEVADKLDIEDNTIKVKGKDYKIEEVVSDYSTLRDTTNELVSAELDESQTDGLEGIRERLNKAYDLFVGKYGTLNRNAKLDFLEEDDNFISIQALENEVVSFKKSKSGRETKQYTYEKSDIFSKQVNFISPIPTKADSVTDAISISLSYKGKVDLNYSSQLLNISEEAVKEQMLESREVFENPQTGELIHKDDYLSGAVKAKLAIVKEYAADNKEYQRNVEELEKVIPKDLLPSEIRFSLGTTWMPAEIVTLFADKIMGAKISVAYNSVSGKWVINLVQVNDRTLYNKFGTPDITPLEVLSKKINLVSPTIYDHVTIDGKTISVKNDESTAQAIEKLQDLNEAFIEWAYNSNEVIERIVKIYNDIYNDNVEKLFSLPTFEQYPNASKIVNGKEFKLRNHQKKAVQRLLQQSTLLAHQVGTGKTYTMITGAMEMRRLGLAKKPMIVVQNSTLTQFVKDFKGLYPNAKILAPSEKSRSAAKRQKLFNQIAYGDWDAVIIPQSFANFIPDDPNREKAYINQRIAEMMELADATDDNNLKRQIEGEVKSLKKDLASVGKDSEEEQAGKKGRKVKDVAKKMLNAEKSINKQKDRRTDDVHTFEQMGIDALFVDEAHNYKKLGLATSMSRVKGIDSGRSKRAFGMFLKTSWIHEKTGGKNVIFATGTPITNTMAEVWTMMRFISPDILQKYGITEFDQFASTFGQIQPSLELTATGNFKIVDRFKSYINAPELVAAFKTKTDVVLTSDVVEFKQSNSIPKLKNGEFTKIILPQSKVLVTEMERLVNIMKDYEELTGREKKEKSHIPLVVFGQAKQAAIDVRLLNPNNEDDPKSKLNEVVKQALRIYKEHDHIKGTQLIFSDVYQSPDKSKKSKETSDIDTSFLNNGTEDGDAPRFNLYNDIKAKLVANGIPASEVAIMSDYDTADKKERLFEKVNSGEIRFVLGSTEKMGVGVNVQERLAAVHHVDAPPRPMDFEQRNGRIIRQGNIFAKNGWDIEVLTYGVARTLDATAYQRLAYKQDFINQIMKGENLERTIDDDADEDVDTNASFDEMMAQLTGSQFAVAHQHAKSKHKMLLNKKKAWQRTINDAVSQVRTNRNKVDLLTKNIARNKEIQGAIEKMLPDGRIDFITINGKKVTEKIGQAIQEMVEKYESNPYSNKIAFSINGILPVHLIPNVNLYEGGKYLWFAKVPSTYNLSNDSIGHLDETFKGYVNSGAGFSASFYSKTTSYDANSAKMEASLNTAKQEVEYYDKLKESSFPLNDELKEATEDLNRLEELLQSENSENQNIPVEEGEEVLFREKELDKVNNQFNDELNQQMEGNLPNGHIYSLGMPSNPLLASGVANAKIELVASTLSTKSSKDYKSNHPFPLSEVENLPKALANPIAIFESESNSDRFVILTELKSNKANFVAVLGVIKKGGRNFVEINSIISLYPKESAAHIAKWFDSEKQLGRNLLKWADKEKTLRWLSSNSSYVNSAGLSSKRIANIATNFNNPQVNADESEAQRVIFKKVSHEIADSLGVEVETVNTRNELPENVLKRMKKGKRYSGVFDPKTGKITIILDECESEADVQATILHEAVGHKGVRALFGERTNEFLGKVWDSLPSEVQDELRGRFGDNILLGAEEYLAEMAEQDVEPTTFSKIKGVIKDFFRKLGVNLRLKDADLKYILWKAKNAIKKGDSAGSILEKYQRDVEMQEKLFGEDDNTDPDGGSPLFRSKKKSKAIPKNVGVKMINSKGDVFRERVQDRMLSVKRLQEEVIKRGGKVTSLTDIHKAENRQQSAAKAEMDTYEKKYLQPMVDKIVGICEKHDLKYNDVVDYLLAEHSIEREDKGSVAFAKEDPTQTMEEKENAWSRENAEKIVVEFKDKVGYQTADELWETINKATRYQLNRLLKSGNMSRETYDDTISRFRFYVPLRGWNFGDGEVNPLEYYEFGEPHLNGGKGTFSAALIKARGRSSKADNPINYIIQIGMSTIAQAHKNEMKQSALNLVRDNKQMKDLFCIKQVWEIELPDGTIKEITTKPIHLIKAQELAFKRMAEKTKGIEADNNLIISLSQQIGQLRANFIDEGNSEAQFDYVIDKANKGVATVKGKLNRSSEHRIPYSAKTQKTIEVIENGVKYVIEFEDANIARSINGDNRIILQTLGVVGKTLDTVFANPTRYMSSVLTSKNPAFVVANYARDFGFATLYNGISEDGDMVEFWKGYKGSFAAIHRSLTGKDNPLSSTELGIKDAGNMDDRKALIQMYGADRVTDTLMEMFRLHGGETGYVHLEDITDIEKKIKKEVRQQLEGKNMREKVATPFHWTNRQLDYLATQSENSTRFANFMVALNQGKTFAEAASYAKDATVNFNRKGVYAPFIGSLYSFFNASVQGIHSVGKLAYRNKTKFAIASSMFLGASVGVAAMGMLWGGSDDDGNLKWDNLSDYDKFNNWCIPIIGTGRFVKVPLPHIFRLLNAYTFLGSEVYRGRKSAKQAATLAIKLAGSDLTPMGIDPSGRTLMPTVGIPFYDNWVNEDFAGRTIYKEPFTAEVEKYTPNSELGKKGASFLFVELTPIFQALNKLGGGDEKIPAGYNHATGEYNGAMQYGFDWNPSKVQHILDGYTGGLGKFMSDTYRSVRPLWNNEYQAEGRNVPVLNRFYSNPEEQRNVWRTYNEKMDNYRNWKYMFETALKNGDLDRLQELRSIRGIDNSAFTVEQYDAIISKMGKLINSLPDGNEQRQSLEKERLSYMKDFQNDIPWVWKLD